MPKEITIKLTEENRLLLDFAVFQLNGTQNTINQFINSPHNNYSEEHYQRLLNSHIQHYANLQKELMNLMKIHGYCDIAISSFDYFYNKEELTIKY